MKSKLPKDTFFFFFKLWPEFDSYKPVYFGRHSYWQNEKHKNTEKKWGNIAHRHDIFLKNSLVILSCNNFAD